MNTTTENNGTTWSEATAAAGVIAAERAHPPQTFTEELPVKLTEAELAERARRAAAARARVAEYEAQKTSSAAHWKAKIELAENERDELLDVIASGVEERNVEVVETFEFRSGVVTVTRTDTGEKIRERAMSAAERQPDLFDVSGKPKVQIDLAEPRMVHDGDDPGEDDGFIDAGDITDPERVLGEEPPARAKVLRRGKQP